MKKYMLLNLILFSSLTINAQDYPINEDGYIEFVEIVESELSSDRLHSNAKEWIATTFGDYKSVIQFEDDENCKLILKGISKIDFVAGVKGLTSQNRIEYTITIESKDQKYRYKFGDIFYITTINFLGTVVNTKPSSPIDHLSKIEELNNKLYDLKNTDSSKFRKKKLTEHNKEIADLEKNIDEEKTFYSLEYQKVLGIIELLKKGMSKNDDF